MLTREDTEIVAARYADVRPRFEVVAGEVQRRVVNLLHGRVLKSVVTSRAKAIDSLKRSLWRDRDDWSAEVFDGELAPPLMDLAGVRVLLYQEADVVPAKDALMRAFPTLKEKDKRSASGYSAFHLVVHDWCGDDEEHRELRHLPCEIQICTIVEHVWNELEHDIKYKQPSGRPDEGQVELLASLRSELGLCAQTVERLMKRTQDQGRANDEALVSAHDLRRYLERRLNERVDGPFDELWTFLTKRVGRVTPRALDDLFSQGRPDEPARALRDACDPDSAHREVGLVAVMLLPAFSIADVRDAIGETPSAPLLRFMLRVAARETGGKP